MKTLLLIRHAKSSWEDPGTGDFDRPLNDRGLRNAPDMAQRLKNRDLLIDRIVCSPAKRAKETALLFAHGLGLPADTIHYIDNLYLAGLREILIAIASCPAEANTVALVGHNPGITEFANTLTGVRIDNMPTAGIFAIRADCTQWRDFGSSKKEFLFFDYPKAQP